MSDTTNPLTDEQQRERQESIDFHLYEDHTIKTAKVNGPPDESGLQGWTIGMEEGSHFGGFCLPVDAEAPKPGDQIRLYGKGFGFEIWGGDLRGEPCWYKSEAEREAERAAYAAKQEAERQERWAADKDRLLAQYEALDDDLRFRIDRFVANCPRGLVGPVRRLRDVRPDRWSGDRQGRCGDR